jgi:uncharacterized membrane protein YkvI
MNYAHQNETYDYRNFSDRFYGKFSMIFSNLYEVEYIVMVCLAPAVAFATGASILNTLTGIPYIICTMIIGVSIFVVTLFGTDFVRKYSSFLSVMVIAGLLIVLIPNIIFQWDTIMESFAKVKAGHMPVSSSQDGSFMTALLRGCVYGIFQLTAIGLMYQHVRGVSDVADIKKSMIYMFIINSVIMELAVVGLMAVAYLPELAEASVPMLLLVQNGVGAGMLTPIISVLIILGAVSTGVTMISGIVERTVKKVEKKTEVKRVHYVVVSLLFTILAFSVAQFGLIPLIGRGYSYIGYATLFVIIIPFIIHYFSTKFKSAGKPKTEAS